MIRCPTGSFDKQSVLALSVLARLVSSAIFAGAITLPTVTAAQTASELHPDEGAQPIPVAIPVAPSSPIYRLPSKLFISSGFRSVVCPDTKSTIGMLQIVDGNLPNSATLRKSGCRAAKMHMKIREVLGRNTVRSTDGREQHYLAFRGEIWESKGHLDRVYGIVDETAHSVAGHTELEKWQHGHAFFDGQLRRGPGVVKDTISCPQLSTPVQLIKGRQAMDKNPADQDRLRRLEALHRSCQPASGIFHPLAVLKRWERDGWVWTALKAQDSNGKIISLLHSAPKPRVASPS